jgi:hypothetical protein
MRALLSPGKNGPKLKKGDVTEHIIVATVRYALSMAEKGVFDPSELEMIIVDEADNMLGDDTENKQVGCGLLPAASRLVRPHRLRLERRSVQRALGRGVVCHCGDAVGCLRGCAPTSLCRRRRCCFSLGVTV